MKFLTKAALASVALAGVAHAQVLTQITGFGTSDFTAIATFGVDTAGENSYTITGTDFGSTLVGSLSAPFSVANAQGGSVATVYLTATLSGTNPGSGFQIGLYDEDGDGLLFNGNFSSFTVGQASVDLPVAFAGLDNSGTGGFNGLVSSVVFATNGVGSAVNLSMDALKFSAVPEPSAFAALAGIFALATVATRRRRS
jgi:hypothetical protein